MKPRQDNSRMTRNYLFPEKLLKSMDILGLKGSPLSWTLQDMEGLVSVVTVQWKTNAKSKGDKVTHLDHLCGSLSLNSSIMDSSFKSSSAIIKVIENVSHPHLWRETKSDWRGFWLWRASHSQSSVKSSSLSSCVAAQELSPEARDLLSPPSSSSLQSDLSDVKSSKNPSQGNK